MIASEEQEKHVHYTDYPEFPVLVKREAEEDSSGNDSTSDTETSSLKKDKDKAPQCCAAALECVLNVIAPRTVREDGEEGGGVAEEEEEEEEEAEERRKLSWRRCFSCVWRRD
jgi:hypothetical protein